MEELENNLGTAGSQLTSLGPIIPADAIMEAGWVVPGAPKRSRPRFALVAAVTVVVLAAAAGIVWAVSGGPGTPLARSSAPASPAALVPGDPSPSPSAPQVVPEPDPATIDGMFALQARALISGNEKAFLAAVDPKAHAAVTEYRRIFRNMHAMRVKSWKANGTDGDYPITKTILSAITVKYCLGRTGCVEQQVEFSVTARPYRGRVRIESVKLPKRAMDTPAPWLVSDLSVRTAPGIVLAASHAEAGYLNSVLASAKRAAAVANGFARWGKPDVYLIYLASRTEAKVWLGGIKRTDYYVSTTYTVTDTDLEEVLIMPQAVNFRAGPGRAEQTLRWALTYAVASYDNGYFRTSTLSNGLMEYASAAGHPSWMRNNYSDVRKYIHSGHWNGSAYQVKIFSSSNQSFVWAADGMAYLLFRRLVERFGKAKTLMFWGSVVRAGETLQNASKSVFGKSWTSVDKDCARYIRDIAGA